MPIFKFWRTTVALTGNEPIGNAGRLYKANAAGGAQTHAVVAPGTDGRELYVVKTDSSANTVTLTLSLDGTAGASIVLAYKGDAVKLYDDGNTWTALGNRPSAAVLAATYSAKSSNLSDLPSATEARANLGLKTTLLAGAGIDPTGATVSTPAVQTLLANAAAGSTVVVPDGATILLDTQLLITRQLRLTGPGTLTWASGIDNQAAIRVTGAGTRIDGVKMTSYTVTANAGNQSYAVLIEANDCAVEHCWISNFQHGIAVRSNGEWLRTRIADNHVLDVTGAGDGPSSSSSNGEDRGDGITCWGAIATITGNVVTCKAGKDARIGIHAEGLAGNEASSPPLADRMVTITGNTVSGKFRRGITVEDVKNAVISSNTIADSTWWAISIVSNGAYRANSSLIASNTIYWTRTASDNQGSSYAPNRSPIMLYDDVAQAVVSSNTIVIAATAAADNAIAALNATSTGAAVDPVIIGNTIQLDAGAVCPNGISLNTATRPTVTGNIVNVTPASATDSGIKLTNCIQVNVTSNQVVSPNANGVAISFNSTSSGTFVGNSTLGFAKGISTVNSSSGVTVVGNSINSPTAIDTSGVTGQSTVVGNRFGSTVTTGFANRADNVAYSRTAHIGSATPAVGSAASGSLLVGSGKLWVQDAGTWKSVAVA